MGQESGQRKRKYRHWTKFVSETASMRKSKSRSGAGLCIGCGKKPCECKPHPHAAAIQKTTTPLRNLVVLP